MATADKNVLPPSLLSQTSVDQQLQHQPGQTLAASSAITPLQHPAPPVVRITLASMEECNVLLHNGLDFYGATFFPVEAASPVALKKKPLTPNRHVLLFYEGPFMKGYFQFVQSYVQ